MTVGFLFNFPSSFSTHPFQFHPSKHVRIPHSTKPPTNICLFYPRQVTAVGKTKTRPCQASHDSHNTCSQQGKNSKSLSSTQDDASTTLKVWLTSVFHGLRLPNSSPSHVVPPQPPSTTTSPPPEAFFESGCQMQDCVSALIDLESPRDSTKRFNAGVYRGNDPLLQNAVHHWNLFFQQLEKFVPEANASSTDLERSAMDSMQPFEFTLRIDPFDMQARFLNELRDRLYSILHAQQQQQHWQSLIPQNDEWRHTIHLVTESTAQLALRLAQIHATAAKQTPMFSAWNPFHHPSKAVVRLAFLRRVQCPRIHYDKVPLRTICTLYGKGTMWAPEHIVNRQQVRLIEAVKCDVVNATESGSLPNLSKGQRALYEWLVAASPKDLENRLLHGNLIEAAPGSILFLKGSTWPYNHEYGAIHKSPQTSSNSTRLILQIDCGTEEEISDKH